MELDLQRFAGIHTPVQLSRFHLRERRRRQSLALEERRVSAALRIYLVQRRQHWVDGHCHDRGHRHPLAVTLLPFLGDGCPDICH